MNTAAATALVNPTEVHIDTLTYTQSAFGANFCYPDQILDRMAPISRIIGQASQLMNLGAFTVLAHKILSLVLKASSLWISCDFGAVAGRGVNSSIRCYN
jgi:hypothetical protein